MRTFSLASPVALVSCLFLVARGITADPVAIPEATVQSADWVVPERAAPYPAVVLLPSCAIGGTALRDWTRFLWEGGYAVLSLGPGSAAAETRCAANGGDPKTTLAAWRRNAETCVAWVAARPGVDASEIALMGLGEGGTAALLAAEAPGVRAAVALYPALRGVALGGTVPSLVITGRRDREQPVRYATAAAVRAREAGRPLDLLLYGRAGHAFDDPIAALSAVAPPEQPRHASFRARARRDVLAFLEGQLSNRAVANAEKPDSITALQTEAPSR
jgi:dienelactone hydrolase